MIDWHSEVYGRSPTEYINELLESARYDKVRPTVLGRDGYRCRRCKIKPGVHKLSIHHIIPRSENGKTVVENLITLCKKCHDYVESRGFRSITQIENVDIPLIEGNETDVPNWHSWVYGGSSQPNP